MTLAPGQELADRLRIGAAGVAVADVGGEKLDEALLRARAGDEGGRRRRTGGGRADSSVSASAHKRAQFDTPRI
jgi:hypothetical protein